MSTQTAEVHDYHYWRIKTLQGKDGMHGQCLNYGKGSKEN